MVTAKWRLGAISGGNRHRGRRHLLFQVHRWVCHTEAATSLARGIAVRGRRKEIWSWGACGIWCQNLDRCWREMAMSCGDTGCLASVNQTIPCLLPCLWGARSPLACQSPPNFALCSACVAVPPPWPGGTGKGRRCGHAGRAAGSIRPMPSTKA